MFALWLINGPDSPLAQNLAFVANLPPAKLMVGGEHLWSLCLEVQFYAVAAAYSAYFHLEKLCSSSHFYACL